MISVQTENPKRVPSFRVFLYNPRMASILKNDYGLTGITQVEFDARLVLNRVENDSKPRNRQQGELWVDTLENARGTKIEPSRLERGIERAKELLEKVIEIARTMSRGIGR